MSNFKATAQALLAMVRTLKRSVIITLGLLAVGSANAAYTSTKFEPTQLVQGTKLVLSGTGTRYKAIFKVYDMAIYTTRKVNTAQDLLSLPGPKRLNFVALREIQGTDLGVAFLRGISNNTAPDVAQRQTVSTKRLVEIFSGKRKLDEGDTFAMEYIPGKGTTFYITGVAQGDPIGDAEFFESILKIWVGSTPADFKLKEALLGS